MATAGSALTVLLQLHICACVENDAPPFFSVKLVTSCSYRDVSCKLGTLLDDIPNVCLKRLKNTLVEKQPWFSGLELSFSTWLTSFSLYDFIL